MRKEERKKSKELEIKKPSSRESYDKRWCLRSTSQDEKQLVILRVREPGEKSERMEKISAQLVT